MMKKIGIFIIFATLLLPTVVALAQETDLSYTVLAPLPGVGEGDGKTTLETYIPAIFKLAIGLSAVAAVLMIVLGGFQYISSDALMKKSEGRERIKNAVFGLVLVISAWLILNTINPNLLNINLNIESISTTAVSGGSLTPGGTVINLNTQDQLLTHDQAKVALATSGFTIISSGSCSDQQNKNCTSLDNIHSDTVAGLIALKTACSECYRLAITGGTETGHAEGGYSHESGFKADISNTRENGAAFISFISNQVLVQEKETMTTGGFYNITIGGFTYEVHPEGDHMDIFVLPKPKP